MEFLLRMAPTLIAGPPSNNNNNNNNNNSNNSNNSNNNEIKDYETTTKS